MTVSVTGSVYYPHSIAHIYNATMNLIQSHLLKCPCIPQELLEPYKLLKSDDARSAASKKYWADSARSIGLVDTPDGIRYSPSRELKSVDGQQGDTHSTLQATAGNETGDCDKSIRESSRTFSASFHAAPESSTTQDHRPLVVASDREASTKYAHLMLEQMQACVFTEADHLGKRKAFPSCFAGLACRHCFGGYGSGRFFPSSIKRLADTSKTLNVLFMHLMRCRK